jgi:hypothetical protein
MGDLHFVVCMKVAPKPEEVRVDPKTRRLDRAGTRSEINPPDMNALELALGLKDRHGGRVSILSMGPPFFEPYLRVGLAMGADHIYLLSDPQFGGVTGAWLALGGRRRIAGFMGLVLGVLAGWVLWRAGTPYVWVIDAILISAFGEGAQYFSGFVVLATLYALIRWVGIVCESVLLRTLARPTPPASP